VKVTENDGSAGRSPEPGDGSAERTAARQRFAVQVLIAKAIEPGKCAKDRLRLLNLVQEFGLPLGPIELISLQSLLRHRSAAVRKKAEELITAAGPNGVPDNPETAALMRALNPFLGVGPAQRPPRRTRVSDFAAALRGDWDAARRRARSSAAWQNGRNGNNAGDWDYRSPMRAGPLSPPLPPANSPAWPTGRPRRPPGIQPAGRAGGPH